MIRGPLGRGGRLFSAFMLALVALLSAGFGESSQPRVAQFSPHGQVKRVRQVSARFTEPMVPLGDPRVVSSPFDIDCPEPGTPRWTDSRTWVYDFDRDVPGGVRCTFRLRAGLKSLSGGAVGGGVAVFSFSTGGPTIVWSTPPAGADSIDEEQAFVLVLDAPVTEESLRYDVWFEVQGLPERVGVRLLTGEPRRRIASTLDAETRKKPLLVIQGRQRFPSGAKVTLVWGTGVSAPGGVATSRDRRFEFTVRKPFAAKLRCQRENANSNCIPLTPIELRFSAPVAWERAKRVDLAGPDEKHWGPKTPSDPKSFVWGVEFEGPFPEASRLSLTIPDGLQDDAGRSLVNTADFPMEVKTAPFPPLAKFSARFGIVEASGEAALPVTLRNLEPEVQTRLERVTKERRAGLTGTVRDLIDRLTGNVVRVPPQRPDQILYWLRKVGRATRARSVFEGAGAAARALKSFQLPKRHGAKAFEVVGIPLGGPGLYIVEIESPRLGASLLGKPEPMYVPAAALVTNLAVHFKWGDPQSLVWVTTLDHAEPVARAHVAVQDCRGEIVWSGATDPQGIARIDGLPARDKLPRCYPHPASGEKDEGTFFDQSQTQALSSLAEGLLVTAQTDDDMSFVHSSWDDGIEAWRFQLPLETNPRRLLVHTILDRPLFRAGETVHMKHIMRAPRADGLAVPPPAEWPSVVEIRHEGSTEKYQLPLRWNTDGSAESTWEIPKQAKLGTYAVVLSGKDSHGTPLRSGSFRVEEFRVPLMQGRVRLPGEAEVAVSQVPVEVSVQYLAGGGAANLPVVLRSQIRDGSFRGGPELDRFVFGNGGVREGVVRRGMFDEEGGEAAAQEPATVHDRQGLVLDAAGTAHAVVGKLPKTGKLQELLAEMEFRDPNGEVQTVAATVPLWPAKWLVGVRTEDWAASGKPVKARLAVVDTDGHPVAGAPVKVRVHLRKNYSHRKRLVGGFYAYEHIEETSGVLGTLCEGRTDAGGFFFCAGVSPADGDVILEASVADGAGHTSLAHADVWVVGKSSWWFRVGDSDRIDVLPERPRYEPGEEARLQVRMPFSAATALVTVERAGVLDARVVRLQGTEPVIEVPVKGAYAPNVFVSVLAVRGRAGGVQPTAMVDLGKPAFKLGIAEIQVGWRAHELKVDVKPDRAVYHVRDKARVEVEVRRPDGQPLPPGSEVALAAVDEGLLELQPNRSWDLLPAMMGRRGYGVLTATAQMQVVGKRHFGLKALPQGGGGGRQTTRELFDTLLLWRARVPLDARGNASVEVPLNDSLTSFRIVAIATGGAGLFGTGAATIRSTQDLMVLSGVAPMVRTGDQFRAEFTVRNATDRVMNVAVRAAVDGFPASLLSPSYTLAAGEATLVGWSVTAPPGVEQLRYDVTASEPGGATDHLRVTQQVRSAVPVRTFQATLLELDRPVEQPVQRPPDAIPGRGGIDVRAAASLAQGLDTVRDWMRRYPYSCLEQRVSRAVVLEDESLWRDLAAALPSYADADGLLKYFPSMPSGSEVLTAYVLSVTSEAGLALPDGVRRGMVEGLHKFVDGAILRPPAVRAADLSIRKLAAVAALARAGKAEPALLGSIAIEPNLWPTSAVIDWWDILSRMPDAPDRQARLEEAEQIIRARLSLQGTTMGFSAAEGDDLWWLMACPDANPARLVLHLLRAGEWKDDVPRVLRGLLARQRRGHWDCTVSNAWAALAVGEFARGFEGATVTGTTSASLAGAEQQVVWQSPPKSFVIGFPWPSKKETLALRHDGGGAPWVMIRSRAAIPLRAPLSSGYRIRKTVRVMEPRRYGHFSRGDRVRVRLEIEAQSDMTWVVVNDPIPAGASHLGTGLGNDSQIAVQGEDESGWVWPVFAERAFDGYRAYYDFVPKGNLVVEYTIRLNQSGLFQLPPTRVEALYAPEVFGELPNAPIEVEP